MAGLCEECHNHYRNVSKNFDSTSVYSVQKGHENCLQILIDIGADINHPNINNDGPLIWAILTGQHECLKVLIKAGADVNKLSKRGYAPLMMAASEGREECADLLIKAGADVNVRKERGYTALFHAARSGSATIMEHLVKAGADVNTVLPDGKTPLMQAAYDGHAACVDVLLNSGADVNALDGNHSTAMIAAAEGCNADFTTCLRLLLQAGAKINKVNKDNKLNALQSHIFTKRANKKTCMLLFAAGEIVDCTTVDGKEWHGGITQVPVPDYLLCKDPKLNLKHMCRETVRKHLINLDTHDHLFSRIPKLGLPFLLEKYLLYNVSLDDDGDEHEDDDEDESTDNRVATCPIS